MTLSRLTLHTALLAVTLLVLLPATKPGDAYASDEGAAIVQAMLLVDEGRWIERYPLTAIDPDARARPFPKADSGERGLAPYAKHAAYPLVLAAGEATIGWWSYYLLAVAGTVIAAVGAGVLARDIEGAPPALAMWTVGIASPLFFDAYIVLAHSLAAAAAVWSVVAAKRALDRSSIGWLSATLALVAACALLRSEGVLLGGALAAGVLVIGWARQARIACALGGLLVVTVLAVRFVEDVIGRAILGADTSVTAEPVSTTAGFIAGRLDGLQATWFTASYGAPRHADALLFLGAIALAAAAIVIRLGMARLIAVVFGAAAAAAYVARAGQGLPDAVPGLVLAFPAGWSAVWLVRRHHLASPAARLAGTTAALFAAAVLLTQYSYGGGVEWGGRFFALAIPIITPVAVLVLRDSTMNVGGRRGWAACVAVVTTASLALSIIAVQTLRRTHDHTRLTIRATEAAAARVPPHRVLGDRRPIIVSTQRLYPQIAWPVYFDYRWLAPELEDVGDVVCRLAAADVPRFVLATRAPDEDLAAVSEVYRPVARPEPDGFRPVVPSYVMARTGAVCAEGRE